jgi:hypothetical protein
MKSVQSLLFFKPMKEPPTVFPFGPIAELVVIPKRPYRPGEKCYVPEVFDCRYNEWGNVETRYKANGDDPFYSWRSPVTMPQWAARRFVTILSCEPMRVSEVTEEDAIRLGFTFDEYNQVMARENFENDWHQRHPGTWAWRVESEEIKS